MDDKVDELDEQIKKAQTLMNSTTASALSAMTGLREETVALLTSRSKGLLDLAASVTTARNEELRRGAVPRQEAHLDRAAATSAAVEEVLTPRLMELMMRRQDEHKSSPDPEEVAAEARLAEEEVG